MGMAQSSARLWDAGFSPWLHVPGQAILGTPCFSHGQTAAGWLAVGGFARFRVLLTWVSALLSPGLLARSLQLGCG